MDTQNKSKLLVGILVVALIFGAVPALADTYTVDDDGEADFSSIQAAINAAPKTKVFQEKVWGPEGGLQELNDPLEVSVSYEGDKTVFEAEMSGDYDPSEDLMTFTFDTDSDGTANFQIQYNRNGNDAWEYQSTDANEWSGNWEDVPADFSTSKDGYSYSLSIPVSELGGQEADYKFGIDASKADSPRQTLYSTDPEHLWYHEGSYASSHYYVLMTVGETIPAVIEVRPGDYEELVTVSKSVTLKGPNASTPGDSEIRSSEAFIKGKVSIKADSVEFKGFKISPTTVFSTDTGKAAGIFVNKSSILVENNIVKGVTGSGDDWFSIHGIQVFEQGGGESDTKSDIEISHNKILGINNGGNSQGKYGGAVGIKIQNNLEDVLVKDNTVKDVHSAGWAYGIVTTPSSENSTQPKEVRIKKNKISAINDGTTYPDAVYPGVALGVDTASGDLASGPVDATEVEAHYNNLLAPVGAQNKDEDGTLDADNNYWGHASGPSGEDGRTNPAGKEVGKGATVVGNVDWNPWLPHPVGRTEKPGGNNPGPPGNKGPKVKSFTASPNPIKSNQQVTFRAQGSQVDKVRVKVFNTVGSQVYDSNFQNGSTVSWNLVENSGEKVSNGLYLFALSAEVDGEVQKSEVRRLLVIK